ncbi:MULTISPECIES: NUDIX hydrolase [unclassified Acinetobacter]|uniref:NUDIX hydrolase n=1 Tax=unclassified Acinetobacter TaxID=196816 RepID=UPI00190B16E6|nr:MULTISPECIES: NUDIX domain-containing protein [unclassified Acinetobacter]MBK0064927.1 NUDIX domain-containing protein [Acinetobacter sp. S55]MBK0068250.1 NUDIX domain-containing protein [Acinetobacter sp. S54]
MAFSDQYRVGAHAVITNIDGKVLLLKANYGNFAWGLPGGGIDPGETILQGLQRECEEELGLIVRVDYLSGLYLHTDINAHVSIFRCHLPDQAQIQLSHEHSEYAFFTIEELSLLQKRRVQDSLDFNGQVIFRAF